MAHLDSDNLFNDVFINLHSEIIKYLCMTDVLHLLSVNKYGVTLNYYFISSFDVDLFEYRKCYPKSIDAYTTCSSDIIQKIKIHNKHSIVKCKYSDLCKIDVKKYKKLELLCSSEKKIDLDKYSIGMLFIICSKSATLSVNYTNLNTLIFNNCSNININLVYIERQIILVIIDCRGINFQNVSKDNKITLILDKKNKNIVFSDLLYSVKYPDITTMQTTKILAKKYNFEQLNSEEYKTCQDKDKINQVTYYNLTNKEISTTNVPNFRFLCCDINLISDESLYTSNIFRDITYNKNIKLFSESNFNNKIKKSVVICSTKIKYLCVFIGNSFVESLVISDVSCYDARINKIYDNIKIVNSDFVHLDIDYMCDTKYIEIINCTFNVISVNCIKFSKIIANSLFLAKKINYRYIPTLREIDYIYLSGTCNQNGLFTFGSNTNPMSRICDKFRVDVRKLRIPVSNIKLVVIVHSLEEIILTDSDNEFEYIHLIGNIRTIEIPKKNINVTYINYIAITSHLEYKLRTSSKNYVQYVLNYE